MAWPVEGATQAPEPASQASVEGEAPSGLAGGGGDASPQLDMTEIRSMDDETGAKRGPAQVLREEHQATLLKLELIERALDYLGNPPKKIASERVEMEETMLKYLAVALERGVALHFQKEEEALFPVLSEYVGKEHGPIEVMFHEHQEIMTAVRHFKRIVFGRSGNIKPGERGAVEELLEAGSLAVRLLLRHIDKENKILFKVCDISLSEEEREAVLKKMEAMEPARPAPGARRLPA